MVFKNFNYGTGFTLWYLLHKVYLILHIQIFFNCSYLKINFFIYFYLKTSFFLIVILTNFILFILIKPFNPQLFIVIYLNLRIIFKFINFCWHIKYLKFHICLLKLNIIILIMRIFVANQIIFSFFLTINLIVNNFFDNTIIIHLIRFYQDLLNLTVLSNL